MRDAQAQIGVALNDFSHRMLDTGLDNALQVNDPAQVRQEIGRLNERAVQPPLRHASQALQPVQQWMGEIKTGLAAPLQATRSLAEQSSRMRPLVLVVDDDDLLRKILVNVLRSAHYEVESTADATEAMAVLRRRRPDVILMDVQMPDIDGIELTRRLKAAEPYAAIPVIMLTGQGDKGVLAESIAAGANDFIVKPFDREVLLKKVARYAGG
jgi:CheY-like chemotaxis protein